MKSFGLSDPRYFPYLSPPPPENLRAALENLALLGATRAKGIVRVTGSEARVALADTGQSVARRGMCHQERSV